MYPGTSLLDGLRLFFQHDKTKGILLIGEIGGEAELRAAEAIKEYRRTTPNPKPIVAMVAGLTSPVGRTMGHAGAIQTTLDVPADVKARALEEAGAVLVPHPGMMGSVMASLLKNEGQS
jgi:succinyl-CoA synthetase alpha subunit